MSLQPPQGQPKKALGSEEQALASLADSRLRRRKFVSKSFGVLCGASTVLCVVILVGLLLTVAYNAFDAFIPAAKQAAIAEQTTGEALGTRVGAFFSSDYWSRAWRFLADGPSRKPEEAGVNPAILGSLWLISLTALFSVPAGVGAAIYLEEYAAATRSP